jgi:aspartate/tyrosine/aromatic aminotransferase
MPSETAEHNRIQLVWVQGHTGSDEIEITGGLLAQQGSSHSLAVPEPALDISAEVASGVVRGWTCRKYEYWQSIYRKRKAEAFLQDPFREITQAKNNYRAANRALSFKRTSF